MADILIRGMEMPPSCSDCPMCYDQMECTIRPIRFWHEELPMDFCNERHPDCPLVELPEHGNLISKDDAMNAILGEPPEAHYPSWYASIVNEIPTIVPSNKGETE